MAEIMHGLVSKAVYERGDAAIVCRTWYYIASDHENVPMNMARAHYADAVFTVKGETVATSFLEHVGPDILGNENIQCKRQWKNIILDIQEYLENIKLDTVEGHIGFCIEDFLRDANKQSSSFHTCHFKAPVAKEPSAKELVEAIESEKNKGI